MASRFREFDRSRLKLLPLSDRQHDLHLSHWLSLDDTPPPFAHPDLGVLASRLAEAKRAGAARILMMGAHLLRAGVSRHLIDLIERGFIDLVATNGAGAIHDYELALIGATTESVARYVSTGQFGLWQETGEINEIVRQGAAEGLGIGEAVGRAIQDRNLPHRELSVFAAAWRNAVPVTVHVGIGYDIIHEHPNLDPAALGRASYHDFLVFAANIEKLERGVLMNFGSAIMGPEVYLKALSMARNVAAQEGRPLRHFTTAVFDLIQISGDFRQQLSSSDPGYYFRPHKTILVRTVHDGGESFYFQGHHRATLPALRRALLDIDP